MIKLNLLLTEGPRLVYCNFSAMKAPKQSGKGFPVECQYAVQIKINNKKKELIASFSAKSENENVPFSFDIRSEAKFKCEESCPSEQQAIVEAIPYIFPFVKELVADLTRKAYLTPFYLPPIELNMDKFDKASDNG